MSISGRPFEILLPLRFSDRSSPPTRRLAPSMRNSHSTLALNRRAFLGRSGLGLMALGSLLNPGLLRSAASTPRWTGVVNPPHHPPRARRVIFLYMAGGPSHLETFDYKPQLARLHG